MYNSRVTRRETTLSFSKEKQSSTPGGARVCRASVVLSRMLLFVPRNPFSRGIDSGPASLGPSHYSGSWSAISWGSQWRDGGEMVKRRACLWSLVYTGVTKYRPEDSKSMPIHIQCQALSSIKTTEKRPRLIYRKPSCFTREMDTRVGLTKVRVTLSTLSRCNVSTMLSFSLGIHMLSRARSIGRDG
jgi:hypothetical protein